MSFAFITQTSLVLSGSVLLSGMSLPGKSSFLLRRVDVCGICLREYGEQHPRGKSPYRTDLCPPLLWILVLWKEKGAESLLTGALEQPRLPGLGTAASESSTLPLGPACRGQLQAGSMLQGPAGSGQMQPGTGRMGGVAGTKQGCCSRGRLAGEQLPFPRATMCSAATVPTPLGQGPPWGCVLCSKTDYSACRYLRLQH